MKRPNVRRGITSLLALAVAACGADGGGSGASGAGASGGAGADAAVLADAAGPDAASADAAGPDSTAGSDGAAQGVPLVDLALEGKCPPASKKPGTGVAPGNELAKVTLSAYPEAVCNDGSPAILYVRRAAVPAAEQDWVIFLQFGGACTHWQECRDRWCSNNTSFDAAKMSSRFAPPATRGNGLLLRHPANALGNANQVLVYYCSSDAWLGRKNDVVLQGTASTDPSFRMHFKGFSIVQAVDDALAKGVKSDDGSVTMPKLSDAKRIIFAGASAGAVGQTSAVDWWAARYPKAEPIAYFDSTVEPLAEDVADAAIAKAHTDAQPARFQSVFRDMYDAHLDESCVAAHPGADAHLCANWSHVRMNHVTTPYFLRHDLRDIVMHEAFAVHGLSLADFAIASKKTLERHKNLQANAEEKAAIQRNPGLHVSNCGQHIITLDNAWFGVAPEAHTVETGDGKPLTAQDAFMSWAKGSTVQAIDTHPSTKSKCLKLTGEK